MQNTFNGKVTDVIKIHNDLAAVVAPAKPKAIFPIESDTILVSRCCYLMEFRFLAPIKIIGGMMGVSVAMLLTFQLFAQFDEVNLDNLSLGL